MMKPQVPHSQESLIRAQKDKKIQKHFSISLGQQKVKIANFYFKDSQEPHTKESIRLLVLVTKLKFKIPSDQEITIQIPQDPHTLTFIVRFHHSVHAPGTYQYFLRVNELVPAKSC